MDPWFKVSIRILWTLATVCLLIGKGGWFLYICICIIHIYNTLYIVGKTIQICTIKLPFLRLYVVKVSWVPKSPYKGKSEVREQRLGTGEKASRDIINITA